MIFLLHTGHKKSKPANLMAVEYRITEYLTSLIPVRTSALLKESLKFIWGFCVESKLRTPILVLVSPMSMSPQKAKNWKTKFYLSDETLAATSSRPNLVLTLLCCRASKATVLAGHCRLKIQYSASLQITLPNNHHRYILWFSGSQRTDPCGDTDWQMS